MAGDDFLGKPTGHLCRSLTVVEENLVIECLRALWVLFPPLPQRGHVMGEQRTHTKVRILFQTAKTASEALGHGLDFKREDAQTLHNRRHTSRHHSQILGTYKHLCGGHQRRKLFQGFSVPEVVMSVIIIMFVQTAERILVLH